MQRAPATSARGADALLPLVRRYPALAVLPRAILARLPTPVVYAAALSPSLWIKRDDLTSEAIGGSKVRALEFLLGGVRPGDEVLTVGGTGSTHALATAVFARQLGAKVTLFRWRQEMNDSAEAVQSRIAREASSGRRGTSRFVVGAYARALLARLRGARWIPAGGSVPLGVLGHVNAALELADQIAQSTLPAPSRIVVPLGSGGTTAGIALGARIAGLEAEIVGVRVVPRLVANRSHVRALAGSTASLIERVTKQQVPRVRAGAIRVVHSEYGGAYGRPTAAGEAAARRCRSALRITLDATYSAKALAAALALTESEGGTTLFWLTFDGRWMK
jgi:1-aminocyclopropane-1-carboxylate deaminase/D-cysteine desulfhydrase-like pyridoxal-dependent ACC family enzyme